MPNEFQPVPHTGGKVTFHKVTTPEGRTAIQMQWTHCRPNASSLFAIFATYDGVPVSVARIGGLGDVPDTPPPGCLQVMIGSDSHGHYGHTCPKCKKYWRSNSNPRLCPYCGHQGNTVDFLTPGQRVYIEGYCAKFNEALNGEDGDYTIDMDAVADALDSEAAKPELFYADESQQTQFHCNACNEWHDIIGNFGFCSTCGTRNDLQYLDNALDSIRSKLQAGDLPSDCVKDAVSLLETLLGKYTEQLLNHVPLTKRRFNKLAGKRFHNLLQVQQDLNDVFGIDLFEKLNAERVQHAVLMFHRRHIYEHKGGEVDQKYIDDTSDSTVRLGQRITETSESAHQLLGEITKIAQNMHDGFHEILKPHEAPIKMEKERQERMKRFQT